MATYTTFYYYRDSIHYRDMQLYYRDSGKIWLSPSPITNFMHFAKAQRHKDNQVQLQVGYIEALHIKKLHNLCKDTDS